MKKVLLAISRYLSGFLRAVLIVAFLPLYVMFVVPAGYWFSGGSSANNLADSVGLIWVRLFQADYPIFFLFPVLPFFGAFLIISVFVWIYYRHDKEASGIGFKNTILCVLAIFFLVFIPIKAGQLGYKIHDQVDKDMTQLHGNDDTVYINKGFNKEFFKLYQSLADEGIQVWRKDPVAVAKNELEKGDLTSLSHGVNELTVETTDIGNHGAIVMLKNERLQAEIWLSQYWESADGVWLVKSYKILTGSSNEKK
jgi:hypothetical protein